MNGAFVQILKITNFPRYKTTLPQGYRAFVKILPKDEGSFGNLNLVQKPDENENDKNENGKKKREFLRSPVTWNFQYEDVKVSSLVFHFLYGEQVFAILKLPLSWFQKNTVVTYTYPALLLLQIPNPKKIMVKIAIHLSENNEAAFAAPKGKLLVAPAWTSNGQKKHPHADQQQQTNVDQQQQLQQQQLANMPAYPANLPMQNPAQQQIQMQPVPLNKSLPNQESLSSIPDVEIGAQLQQQIQSQQAMANQDLSQTAPPEFHPPTPSSQLTSLQQKQEPYNANPNLNIDTDSEKETLDNLELAQQNEDDNYVGSQAPQQENLQANQKQIHQQQLPQQLPQQQLPQQQLPQQQLPQQQLPQQQLQQQLPQQLPPQYLPQQYPPQYAYQPYPPPSYYPYQPQYAYAPYQPQPQAPPPSAVPAVMHAKSQPLPPQYQQPQLQPGPSQQVQPAQYQQQRPPPPQQPLPPPQYAYPYAPQYGAYQYPYQYPYQVLPPQCAAYQYPYANPYQYPYPYQPQPVPLPQAPPPQQVPQQTQPQQQRKQVQKQQSGQQKKQGQIQGQVQGAPNLYPAQYPPYTKSGAGKGNNEAESVPPSAPAKVFIPPPVTYEPPKEVEQQIRAQQQTEKRKLKLKEKNARTRKAQQLGASSTAQHVSVDTRQEDTSMLEPASGPALDDANGLGFIDGEAQQEAEAEAVAESNMQPNTPSNVEPNIPSNVRQQQTEKRKVSLKEKNAKIKKAQQLSNVGSLQIAVDHSTESTSMLEQDGAAEIDGAGGLGFVDANDASEEQQQNDEAQVAGEKAESI